MAADAVGVTRHHQRPVPQLGQDAAGDLPVVPDQFALRDPGSSNSSLPVLDRSTLMPEMVALSGLRGAHHLGPALGGFPGPPGRDPCLPQALEPRMARLGGGPLAEATWAAAGARPGAPPTPTAACQPQAGSLAVDGGQRSCRLARVALVKPVPTLPA